VKYIVNFDFDCNFPRKFVDLNYKNRAFFEWIFFFLNNDENNILYSKEKYSESYFKKISNFGAVLTKITTDDKDVVPWWGNFEDFEIKKKYISKIDILSTLKDLELIPSFVRPIKDQKDLDEVLSVDGQYFFREEYSFSGIGSCTYQSNTTYPFKRGVIAPLLDVVLTFGVTVNLETNEYFICSNRIGRNGAFVGGRVVVDNEIASLLEMSELEFKESLLSIFNDLRNNNAKGTIQFDSLIYNNSGVRKWYQIVEVNYRKTMGLLIKKLFDLFGDGEFVISHKPLSEGILISPDNLKLKSYYIPIA